MSFTSVGAALISSEIRNAFIQTDFPEPVCPAIRTCGILAISATTGLPETSNPKATSNLDLAACISCDSIIFLRGTNSAERLGSSIPTKFLPGIGASILMVPVGADSAKAKSLSKEVILESLVPRATSMAYWVTAGPKFTSTTFAVIPNDSSVFSIVAALPLMSPRSACPPSESPKISISGYLQTVSSPGILLTSFCSKGSLGAAVATAAGLLPVGKFPPETFNCPFGSIAPPTFIWVLSP
ncbi:MAG: hypothetical protein ACD_13C00217G0001 [uncultured bacterium]|nr:MAG: hypothetical protein ACD_13C00217G0001 [uncultured bacterium]